jgi:sugar lactone lactonase YvrE
MKKIYLLITAVALVSLLFLVKCNDVNEPIVDNDSVPQIDIPWPSLADSPWPMYHHDPQSTGRSKFKGPQLGVISKKIRFGYSASGIVIGKGQRIFFTGYHPPGGLYCFDYDGNNIWRKEIGLSSSTPLVLNNNNICTASLWGLVNFDQNGDKTWTRKADVNLNDDSIMSIGINVDKQGNIYYVDRTNTLKVINQNGELLWKLKDTRFLSSADSAPSFSPDGNTLYVQGTSVSIFAVDINSHKIKWTYEAGKLLSSPVIDNAGNIYLIPGNIGAENGRIVSLTPMGNVRWGFDFVCKGILDNTEPTIDYNGNIYFGSDTLFSFTNSGKLRWKVALENFGIVSALVCDRENTIYVGTSHGNERINKLFAITERGVIKWVITDTEERLFGPSPAISENGLMFQPSWNSTSQNYLIIM